MTIKKRTRIKIFVLLAAVVVALFFAVWSFVSHQLSHLETYKSSLTATLSKAVNRDVTYEKGKATLTFRNGIALQFTHVVIRNKDRSSELLNIKTAWIRVDILPLIFNRIIFGEVVLDSPRFFLKRDENGILNINDLLDSDQKSEMTVSFQKITIRDGLVTFLDQAATAQGLKTTFENLSCQIQKSPWSEKFSFHINSLIREDKNNAELTLNGSFRPSSDQPIAKSAIHASIRINGTNMRHYLPYVNPYVPFKQLAGRLDVDLKLSGTLQRFTSKGTIGVKNFRLHYPTAFRGPIKSQALLIDYALERQAGNLQVDIARLAIDHFEASGRFSLHNMDQDDPQLTATASTSPFSLNKIQTYVPWEIIPQSVGSFIETHIPNGNFRLVEGKLAGRLSQIENMNRPENADVLSIRADVQNGIFWVNQSTPHFQEISGTIELTKRRFLLKNINGRFGESPCELEGDISDFALPGPNVYTVKTTLQPVRKEVLWLLGKENFSDLGFEGESTLHLSGKGPADNFRISARWDLTHAAYTYPTVIAKPKGRLNTLDCFIALQKDQLKISSFQYDLPPLTISGSAADLFAEKKSVVLNFQARTFDLRDIASFLPALQPYDPAGNGSILLTARGNLADPSSFRWKGNLSLAHVSLNPPGNIKPIKGLTGSAFFRETRMETSLFHVTLGETPFQLKCGIDNFQKPNVACQFSTAKLRTEDLGLQSPEDEILFQDVKGKITFEDQYLQVDKLSAKLGKSRFNVSGNIRDFTNPKILVSLNSPYIHWNDVERLMTLKNPQQKDDASSNVELEAVVHVDAGVFQDIDFNKLHAKLNFSKGNLNIESLETALFDGALKGKGTLTFVPDGLNQYAASFTADRMSLDKLQGFLELEDRTVTGRLSLAGQITAKGNNTEDLKNTAAGSFKVRADKGILKKFSVLSKIFSLLNVSQLFRLRLPDMAKEGMPYKSITGDLILDNGVLSSNNFFIESNAMQISGVGKIDFLKKELDNIIGVHPLHTVDLIVAKIPVAGWLVTDDKGNLITVHFKVDGTWDDPNVRPIPVQSMAKGTLDIFRRLFQLPGKLITDTGEVILGH